MSKLCNEFLDLVCLGRSAVENSHAKAQSEGSAKVRVRIMTMQPCIFNRSQHR